MHHDYKISYQTLDLPPGSEWHEIRAAYRTLTQKWHPDRFATDLIQQRLAERKMREITKAHRILEEYYQLHGVTPVVFNPPSFPAGMRHTTTREASDPIRGTSPDDEPAVVSATGRKSFVVAVLAGAILTVIFLITDKMPEPSAMPADQEQTATAPNTENNIVSPASNNAQRFTAGSTLGEVITVQGVPSKIENDTWHYGKSSIHFHKGVVSSWNDHPDSPLKISLNVPAKDTHAIFFGYGSSKTDVRAIQGNPSRETETLWEYGTSKVHFHGDHVSGWYESPLYPLRTAK